MIENAHPILRWFGLCSSMNWAHLPVEGGLYDQHPDLIEGFNIIFAERASYEAEKEREEERKNKTPMGRGRTPAHGTRPRSRRR